LAQTGRAPYDPPMQPGGGDALARVGGDAPSDAKHMIMDEFERATGPLVARMLDNFRATIPTYTSLPEETVRQVREVVHANLLSIADCLRDGREPTAEDMAPFLESAARRAREGVELTGLLEAYRHGAREAWQELRRITEEHGEHAQGLEFATLLMAYIDTVSGAVADAYLAEFESLTSDREAARRDFLDGLLHGSLTDGELSARAAALGLDPAVAYAVCLIAVLGDGSDGETLRTKQRSLRSMVGALPNGQRSLIVNRGAELVAIVPCPPGGEDELRTRLEQFMERAAETLGRPLAVGIARVHEDLTELASGYREASVALAAARSGTPRIAVYGQVLMEELILREPAISRRLVSGALDPLRPHPYLIETLEVYLRQGPSLPDVAETLHVHANTVAYRLGRIRELTGRDPRTPLGVAHLALALRAAELLGEIPDVP
jgi:hypothetical protein